MTYNCYESFITKDSKSLREQERVSLERRGSGVRHLRRGWCSQFNLTGIGDRPSHLDTLCWILSREQVRVSCVQSLCHVCVIHVSRVSSIIHLLKHVVKFE